MKASIILLIFGLTMVVKSSIDLYESNQKLKLYNAGVIYVPEETDYTTILCLTNMGYHIEADTTTNTLKK